MLIEESKEFRFWRSNGSVFILLKNLEDLCEDINMYIQGAQLLVKEFGEFPIIKRGEEINRLSLEKLNAIKNSRTIYLPNNIRLLVDSIILMVCITLETEINYYCYYEVGEECCEAIEKLNMVDKLTIYHWFKEKESFKQLEVYHSVYKLNKWRNKFAHGKVTDVNSNEIKKNNLNLPRKSEIKNTYANIISAIEHLKYYFTIIEYLSEGKKDLSYNNQIILNLYKRIIILNELIKNENNYLINLKNTIGGY